MTDVTPRATTSDFCDDVAALLKALRARDGDPSYAELVRRVMAQRMAHGMSEWEARVGRTTVYDAFRLGRRTLDLDLVSDLVRALGGSEIELTRCLEGDADPALLATAAGSSGAPDDPATPAVSPPESAPAPAEPRPVPSAPPDPARGRPAIGVWLRVALMSGCVAINLAGRGLVDVTHLPLYLDMVGTAIAAIVLGPWSGAAVGVATAFAGIADNGWISAAFTPVEIVGALIWGYGTRRWHLARTVPRFLALTAVVAIACSLVAVPIIFWGEAGFTGSGADQLTRTMDGLSHSLLLAVASQNLLTSFADKFISGFVALAVAEALPAWTVPGPSGLRLRSPWLQSAARSVGAGAVD